MLSENLLAAVRAEISAHEAALAKLREVERLVGELAPAPPPRAPDPGPARRARPRSSRNGGATRPRASTAAVIARRQAILSLLATRGPLSPGAVAEALGEPVATVRSTLRQLAGAHEISARGATSSRIYDVARREVQDGNGNGDGPALDGQVLDVVMRCGGWIALSEIEYQLRRRHIDFDRGELERAAVRLSTRLLVVRDQGGRLQLPERPVEQAIMDAAGVESL